MPLVDSSRYYQGFPRGHQGPRAPLQRPFSFTHGVIPEVEFSEALGAQLGTFYFRFSSEENVYKC